MPYKDKAKLYEAQKRYRERKREAKRFSKVIKAMTEIYDKEIEDRQDVFEKFMNEQVLSSIGITEYQFKLVKK